MPGFATVGCIRVSSSEVCGPRGGGFGGTLGACAKVPRAASSIFRSGDEDTHTICAQWVSQGWLCEATFGLVCGRVRVPAGVT